MKLRCWTLSIVCFVALCLKGGQWREACVGYSEIFVFSFFTIFWWMF